MEGLIEGRKVHYVMTGQEPGILGHVAGRHRPAEVVRVLGDTPKPGYANLRVSLDGANDTWVIVLIGRSSDVPVQLELPLMDLWATSVHYSEDQEPGTWHWIEQA